MQLGTKYIVTILRVAFTNTLQCITTKQHAFRKSATHSLAWLVSNPVTISSSDAFTVSELVHIGRSSTVSIQPLSHIYICELYQSKIPVPTMNVYYIFIQHTRVEAFWQATLIFHLVLNLAVLPELLKLNYNHTHYSVVTFVTIVYNRRACAIFWIFEF